MPTATIEQNRQREYERYQSFETFEVQRRLTDEITDMSERLAAPMRNTFEYETGSDGELWFQGEPIRRIFDDGIKVAQELTRSNPHFATELVRRHLERQEYDEMRNLALGGENDPDVLVVLSPIPDEVLSGEVQLNAYDTERRKTLVRIFRRNEKGLEATSLSLDLSDRDGLSAIAEQFGQTIDAGASSEDILAMRLWGYRDQLGGGSAKLIRDLYDRKLTEKFGGEWYAGRRSSLVTDTKAFIETQHDLIAQHMEELMTLKKKHSGKTLDAKLEEARYNLAAALTRRMRGDTEIGSLSEAGATARAKGEIYNGDCPTGTTVTMEKSLSQIGIGRDEHMRCVTCPICGAKGVDGIVSSSTIRCSKNNCTVDRKTGKVLRGPGGVQKASEGMRPKKARLNAKAVFGSHVEERTLSSIGSAEKVVYDRSQDRVIARVTDKGFAAPV